MSAGRGALVVLAKQPRAGQVKTRMTPPLTPEQAAALYGCLLRDILEASAAIAEACDLEPVLAVQPASACAELAELCPASFRVVAQRGADLGERMERAAREAEAAGRAPILLRGSDSPTLDATSVHAALDALRTHELAVCPDRDGGYNLVGLCRAAPGLFAHPMSTRSALEDTLANARRLGWRTAVLPARFDLDRVEDLRWLAAARGADAEALCPRTLAYLDTHDLWRFARGDDAAPDGLSLAGPRGTR
ncbi:MAG TPA: TIGR04282 family arsenosugar biosynthesis glycosyltransferase [Myxococcota bacterium]